jgi:HD superfamily phosphohydrolase
MKNKILNDPVFGFINVLEHRLLDIIEHPFFQRLKRIKQLGLTYFVYPGALHTRFHNTLGATHLMGLAINVLRSKNVEITDEEELAAKQAILLHDIGHGPFSHALEHSIVNVSHEDISLAIMEYMNQTMNLSTAIKLFKGQYHKKFLHDLISSNLDVDRLDYLKRDSFFTGVSEGVIGTERIIKMLNVRDNNLVVENKGLHSVENFLIARELMYWQVYLHKTVTIAEQMLIKVLKRAKTLAMNGEEIFASPVLRFFLYNDVAIDDFGEKINIEGREMSVLKAFTLLDDYDIMSAIKVWAFSDDKILSELSQRLLNRQLFKIAFNDTAFDFYKLKDIENLIKNELNLNDDEVQYYFINGKIVLPKASSEDSEIKILNGEKVVPLSKATEILNINMFSKSGEKHYIIFPAEVRHKVLELL